LRMTRQVIVVSLSLGEGNLFKEIGFKIKTTVPLYKLKQAVAEKVGLPGNILLFECGGVEIADDDTVDSLNWKDLNKIDVTRRLKETPKEREIDQFEQQLKKLKLTTRENLVNDIRLKKEKLKTYKHMQTVELEPIENAIRSIEKSLRQLKSSLCTVEKRFLAEATRKRDEILQVEAELEYFDKTFNTTLTLTAPSVREFDCPVCYEMMEPPRRIFQCQNGHLICENCKAREELKKCPTCRLSLGARRELLSRNLAMEKLVENFLAV